MATQGKVTLKRNRDKPVRRHHPWVFSGSIARVEGEPAPGDVVDVHDTGNNWLARGYLNRQSQISVRLLTWKQDQAIDADFWRTRLQEAIQARRGVVNDAETTAYRVVHAESDYLPGLVVDRYGDWLVIQSLTLGIDRHREPIVGALTELIQPRGIYERSDVDVREKEGLDQRTGLIWGEPPPETIEIVERGRRYLVDVRQGHKTGFYLDQSENRSRLAAFCAGARVLDAFAYTGGFSVTAAGAGAERVTLIDSSAPALEMAGRNLALNGVADGVAEIVKGNVFSVLRGYRAQERRFDVVVLDPPKFAHSRGEVDRASRAYKDINLLAFQLLRPGGILFTFSCSGDVSAQLFQKIVFSAAVDTNHRAQIIARMTQDGDHPVALTFPEGAYLKGAVCRTR